MTSSTQEPKPSKKGRQNRKGKAKSAKKSKQANLQPKKDKPVKPPKPIKYVSPGSANIKRPANSNLRTDLLSSHFEVLVGTSASQQMFSIHEQVVTKRSEFFRVGRQKRWNQKNEAKMMLLGEDPHVFSAYLHIVYFGPDHLKKLITPDAAADSSASEDNDDEAEYHSKGIKAARFLIDLYILADNLLDPVTANLVIDEFICLLDLQHNVWCDAATHVYTFTKESSLLRRVVLDFYVHDIDGSWPSKSEWVLSYAFLQDIIIETRRLQSLNPLGIIEEVFLDYPEAQEDRYHQKVDQQCTGVGQAEASAP
jgi:hypothetical protein